MSTTRHAPAVLALLLAPLFAGCPPPPCCTVDADCADEGVCVEGVCTIACADDGDCLDTEVCATTRSSAQVGRFCVAPGGVPAGTCPEHPPKDDGGGADDGGPIGPCTDDALEPNGTRETASPPPPETAELSICAGDEDWFRVDLDPGQGARARIEFEHDDGDLDLLAYWGTDADPFIASTGTDDVEEVFLPDNGGTFFLKVFGWNGEANPYYAIEIELELPPTCGDVYEPNDDLANATVPVPAFVTAAICPVDDEDFYRFVIEPGETLFATLAFTHADGDLDLFVASPFGDTLAQSNGTTDVEEIAFPYVAAFSNVLVVVRGFAGATNDYTLTTSIVAPVACGNGVLEAGEQCDDGNTASGDGCSATCTLEVPPLCGNGVLNAGEQCDDGNTTSGDGCSAMCTLEAPLCGNGVVNAGEQCDDGNTTGGDGCSAACAIELPTGWSCVPEWFGDGLCDCGCAALDVDCPSLQASVCEFNNCPGGVDPVADDNPRCELPACGDGVVNPPVEQCDDGNTANGDGCNANCQREAVCGDGVVNPPVEQCDDGNTVGGDGCSALCTVEVGPVCGNGVIEPPFEQCDDGNTVSGDGCSSACTVEAPLCGNGVLNPGEQCDDGNTMSGDGCSALCTLEAVPVCGNGVTEPPLEQCDDGNLVPGDGCSPLCTLEGMSVCGNGVVEPPFEQCDDGNLTNGDGCSSFCGFETPPQCGDGMLDPFEQCDDGNTVAGDGCSPFCTVELPLGWTCVDWYYGDGICDCGCGVIDSDCPGLSSGFCGFNNCPNGVPPVADDNTRCTIPSCGNGTVEPPLEQCDDGNLVGGDGCSSSCQAEPRCGDGFITGSEQCDDGNTLPGDGCSPFCTIESVCGNGELEGFEQCDDGNTLPNDGCSPFCTFEGNPICGNGIVEPPFESCDDGNTLPNDGCSPFCTAEAPPGWSCPPFWFGDQICDCGCGVLDVDCPSLQASVCGFNNCPGVEPVPDNNPQCLLPTCGNGLVDSPFEQCDDGNLVNGDGCNLNCQLEPVCGNGIIDGFEQCDDGNLNDGDGCSASCTTETPPEWTCFPEWFGDGICDCGCGALDLDCNGDTSVAACGFDNCAPLAIDPDDNSQCIEIVCADDFFEDNDSAATSTEIIDGNLTNAVLCPDDPDFFRFFAPAGAAVTVTLQYTAPPSMTLRVSRPGVGLIDQVTGGGGNLSVVFDSTFDGLVGVRVTGNSLGAGIPRPYALTVSIDEPIDECLPDAFEPNDDPFTAPEIDLPFAFEATACVDDVDIFRLPLGTTGALELSLFSDQDSAMFAAVFTEAFEIVGFVNVNTGPIGIDLPATMGALFVGVGGGTGESYVLEGFPLP